MAVNDIMQGKQSSLISPSQLRKQPNRHQYANMKSEEDHPDDIPNQAYSLNNASSEHLQSIGQHKGASKVTASPGSHVDDKRSIMTGILSNPKTNSKIKEINAFRNIEQQLQIAKRKLYNMENAQQHEHLNINKKEVLKNENRQLREQLKAMSSNVNLLINQLNKEQLSKDKKGEGAAAAKQKDAG